MLACSLLLYLAGMFFSMQATTLLPLLARCVELGKETLSDGTGGQHQPDVSYGETSAGRAFLLQTTSLQLSHAFILVLQVNPSANQNQPTPAHTPTHTNTHPHHTHTHPGFIIIRFK